MENRDLIRHNGFSVASLIFGVLAILTCVAVVFVPLNSGLAITFAYLSRGNGRMSAEAKVGLVLAVLGIIIAVTVSAAAVSFLLRMQPFGGFGAFGAFGPVGRPGGLLH